MTANLKLRTLARDGSEMARPSRPAAPRLSPTSTAWNDVCSRHAQRPTMRPRASARTVPIREPFIYHLSYLM